MSSSSSRTSSTATTRIGTTASLAAKKADEHVHLARGWTGRYLYGNKLLQGLNQDEWEKDLRHMEAFGNACVAYAQQHYIYQTNLNNSGSVLAAESSSKKKKKKKNLLQQQSMPIRIDPEEEKRLSTLRERIAQAETKREAMDREYVSLRAHYVHLSQALKELQTQSSASNMTLLQGQLRKRGILLGLSRARLQIARDVLHRLQSPPSAAASASSTSGATEGAGDTLDPAAVGDAAMTEAESPVETSNPEEALLNVWNDLEEQFQRAEQACRTSENPPPSTADNSSSTKKPPVANKNKKERWHALKMPHTPMGVPLLLSTTAKGPAFCAAWSAGGMWGASQDSLVYLNEGGPTTPDRSAANARLAKEVANLRRELQQETTRNQELQNVMRQRRHSNTQLVAMMALLRTETEAVVARHNILLESKPAQLAAQQLHEQQEQLRDETELPFVSTDNVDASATSLAAGDDQDGNETAAAAGDKRGLSSTASGDNKSESSSTPSPRNKRRKL